MDNPPKETDQPKYTWLDAIGEILSNAIIFGGAWLMYQSWSWIAFLALGIALMIGLPAIFHFRSKRRRS